MKKLVIYTSLVFLTLWVALTGVGKFINSVKDDMDRRQTRIVSSL